MKLKTAYLVLMLALLLASTVFATTYVSLPAKTMTVGETWQLCRYELTVNAIDARATPRQTWFSFKYDTSLLDDAVVSQGANYSYGTRFRTHVNTIFAGATSDMVQLTDSSIDSNALSFSSTKTLTVGETWEICNGYEIIANAIDARASPRQVWITLTHDGIALDNEVLQEGDTYNHSGVISTKIYSIFAGATSDMVQLKNTTLDPGILGGGASCTEQWSCTGWSSCAGGQQTRTCTDANNCGTIGTRPPIMQACVMPPCAEQWSCAGWSACSGSQQTRACTDANNCGTTVNRPATMQACVMPPCAEQWYCSDWSDCTNNQQRRTCVDNNDCGTNGDMPPTTQSCASQIAPCAEVWVCGGWGDCEDGIQVRSCVDQNNCGTTAAKSITAQECSTTVQPTPSCTEKWSCTDWSACSNGEQSRVCKDASNCRTSTNVPEVIRRCSGESAQQAYVGDAEVTVEKSEGAAGTTLKIGGTSVRTELAVMQESSKLFVKTGSGYAEIAITPEVAIKNSKAKKNDQYQHRGL